MISATETEEAIVKNTFQPNEVWFQAKPKTQAVTASISRDNPS
jgi:hypothetical protein